MQCWQDSARFALEFCLLAAPCMVSVTVANWVPYKTVWEYSFSNDGAEPPPSPFPLNLVTVVHKTKIAVKEQAGFNFASDGVWMVFIIEVSFFTVKAKFPSLLSESQKGWVYRHKRHRNSYLHHRILSWSTSETVGSAVRTVSWWKGKRVIYVFHILSSLCRILDKIYPWKLCYKGVFLQARFISLLLNWQIKTKNVILPIMYLRPWQSSSHPESMVCFQN